MPGILFVVATPIGNLEDVTLRALRILREVTIIAAEDTRRTAKLLQHYSISTPTTSLHEHNEHVRAPDLVRRLVSGDSVALVSDAGTPGVSDPGARLITAAHAAGIQVQPIPGPSAAIAMVSASGLGGEAFLFVGFPPNRSNHRKNWLRGLADQPFPIVMYEAPHRILATLSDVSSELGPRIVGIGRELTKVHEQLAVRPISRWLEDPPKPQGEFVLVIGPSDSAVGELKEAVTAATLAGEFGRLAKISDAGRREIMRQVAVKYHVSVRDVFVAVEAAKKSGE